MFISHQRFVHRRMISGLAPTSISNRFHITGDRPFTGLSKRIADTIYAIADFRYRITYYSASQFTNPSKCPSSFEIDEEGDLRGPAIGRSDHLRFVFDLYNISISRKLLYEQYMSIVGKRGLGLVDKVTWRQVRVAASAVEVTSGGKLVREKRDRLLIIPNVHIGRTHLSFNQLSEG